MERSVFNKNKIFIATIYISFFSIIGKVFSFGKNEWEMIKAIQQELDDPKKSELCSK